MPERAIFLDRDNTIIDNDGYLGDPSKVRLLLGAATALASLRALGYRLIVISNQSGVARGMFSEADVESVNQEMCRQLRENAGAHIDASYYCPYHPEAKLPEYRMDHDWRKPKSGMLKQAAIDFNLDLAQCWTVGDMPRDIAAGALAGTRTILLRDPDHPAPENETNTLDISPNFIVKSLADAARIISREGASLHRDPVPVPLSVPLSAPLVGHAEYPPLAPFASEFPPLSQTGGVTTMDDDARLVRLLESALRKLPATPPAPAAAAPASGKIEKTLEELVVQLRHQNRNADMPEFSMIRLVAIIVQVLAVLLFLVGMMQAIRAPETGKVDGWWYFSALSLYKAFAWLLGAIVLQGAVIAMLLQSRSK